MIGVVALCLLQGTLLFGMGNLDKPEAVKVVALGANRKMPHGQREGCAHVIYTQPASRYAALYWCEDALGSNFAVLDIGHIAHSDSPGDRFWTEDSWGKDVHHFEFSPDGSELMVVSSEIYGSGKFYLLDLVRKRSKELGDFRNDLGAYSEISVDWAGRSLSYKFVPEDGGRPEKKGLKL